jgi:hypothetical protein
MALVLFYEIGIGLNKMYVHIFLEYHSVYPLVGGKTVHNPISQLITILVTQIGDVLSLCYLLHSAYADADLSQIMQFSVHSNLVKCKM